jgi:ankyrin repeat protein
VGELEKLVDAAKTGDGARVRVLITRDPNLALQRLPSGESPLMAALYRGHSHVVSLLVDLGAEIDVFAAAATGNVVALQQALKQPGAVNAYAYDGWTPLHLAAFFGQSEAVRMLLEAGADLQALSRNSLTNTPLHAATAGRHEEVAVMLVERGADSAVADAGGHTPLRIATENGLQRVLAAIPPREP